MTKEEWEELKRFEKITSTLKGEFRYGEDTLFYRLIFLRGKKEGWEQGQKHYHRRFMSLVSDGQNKRWKKIEDEQ